MNRVFLIVLMLLTFQLHAQVPDSMDCKRIDTIYFWGKTNTKDAILLRELSVKQGDCILISDLMSVEKLNHTRLMSLLLFNEVKVNFENNASSGVDMSIFILDKFPIFPEPNLEFADRNFNVWYKEEHLDFRRINIGLNLVHNNFRGRRETLEVGAQVGYTEKLHFLYSLPFLSQKQKFGAGFSVSTLRNREIAYKTENNKLLFYRDYKQFVLKQYTVSSWFTYRPKYAVTHKFQLNYHHYDIADTIALLNPNYLGNGTTKKDLLQFQYRIDYNGVDNWNYPLIGKRVVGTFTQNLPLLGKDWQSIFYLQYDQYFHPLKNYYIGTIFRSKFSFPSSNIDIFKRNLGYDFDYVRGFEYYVIDGSSFALARLDLKRTIVNRKIKLPIRYFEVIPIQVFAKLYGDAGISNNKFDISDKLNRKGLFSTGIGLDFITLYNLKIRIEYTLNNLKEKDLFLHKSGE